MAERFTLTLEASTSTVPAITRLRRLLKVALRVFGLKCIEVRQEPIAGRHIAPGPYGGAPPRAGSFQP